MDIVASCVVQMCGRTGGLGDGVKKGKLTSRMGSDLMLVNNQLVLCIILRNCIKQFRRTAQDHGGRLYFRFPRPVEIGSCSNT